MEHGAGCDMLLVQSPITQNRCKFIGKNADLPREDCQTFVQHPAEDFETGATVKCTFISIGQVGHTFAWVGSQPVWNRGCWGVEMGMNEHQVTVASVALGSKLRDLKDTTERLFDVDLNRLALERASTAVEAVGVIAELTRAHGQGGIMSENDTTGESYDGAFLVVDRVETWLVETTEFYYAARKVTEPWFNMSNHMTIGTDYDRISPDIEQLCVQKGLWPADAGTFNWCKALGQINQAWLTTERKCGGEKFMKERLSKSGVFGFTDASDFFRDTKSGICRQLDGVVTSVSSMLCVYPESGVTTSQPMFTFTCTADPSQSMFKPFFWSMGLTTNLQHIFGSVKTDDGKSLPPKLYSQHRLKVLENTDKKQSAEIVKKSRELECSFVAEYMNALALCEMPHEHQLWLLKYTQAEMQLYADK